MSATTAMFMLAGIWIGSGLLLALSMGRHGHDPFAWWLLGTLLGPLALPLAVSAERRQAERPERFRAGVPGRGPVDVLVGVDASVEHDRAKDQARLEVPRRAVEGGYDLLAVGSRGAGLSKVLLGSTAATLAARSKIPVLLFGGLPTD